MLTESLDTRLASGLLTPTGGHFAISTPIAPNPALSGERQSKHLPDDRLRRLQRKVPSDPPKKWDPDP